VNPSAERIAEHIGRGMQRAVGLIDAGGVRARGVKVQLVRVTEAPGCIAEWIAD
jgi:hypothetical protein